MAVAGDDDCGMCTLNTELCFSWLVHCTVCVETSVYPDDTHE